MNNKIEELQNSNDTTGKLKDGKYEGSGVGFKSTIKVEVEIKGGKIESIEVIENGDDPDYFEKAKALIQSIISTQSTKVDSISGATRSSDGIKSAVNDALKKAVNPSVNPTSDDLKNQLKQAIEEKEKVEKEKEALEAQNTNLREENTSLKSAVEELKKKINETPSSLPSATKAMHENIMSTLNGAMGVEKVKTN